MKRLPLDRWLRSTGGLVAGWLLVVIGVILLVLPGPGTLITVAGLLLLAEHYAWARRILDPMKERAVVGAKKGVESTRAVAMSILSLAWLFALGIVWMVEPRIPTFRLWVIEIGPHLPGGRAAGVGLLASAVVAAAALVYSIRRWYPGPKRGSGR